MRRTHTRIHPRWDRYDYRLPGTYFVTTITLQRTPLLGALRQGDCALSPSGAIVRDSWQRIPERFPGVMLEAFIVMPDHVHALLVLPEQPEFDAISLSSIVGWAKSRSAHCINAIRGTPGRRVWQTSFHDSIAQTPDARKRIRQYIQANPRRAWRKHIARCQHTH